MSAGQVIPILRRSLVLLNLISRHPEGIGAKQLSLELGIPQATCYRIIRTLADGDWLQESGAGTYRIGFGVALLARSWSDIEQRLRELRPLLSELVNETGLSAKISVREGSHAVCVARVEAVRANSISSPVGSKFHLSSAGSAGIMLMAAAPEMELRQILQAYPPKQRGFISKEVAAAGSERMARSYGQHHPSAYAVSVLVDVGQPAALTLMGWPEDFLPERKYAIEARLKKQWLPPTPSATKPQKQHASRPKA